MTFETAVSAKVEYSFIALFCTILHPWTVRVAIVNMSDGVLTFIAVYDKISLSKAT